ncbi:hypothetical protein VaNZ11_015493 [Volvox africanus]|uniref:CDP-diacylglycerol--inositol 3-phosphatidyltransferase n=1 Tax=Volvox africanus TaxID=51714 RepID=A0ABQ5SKQ5_9CHLO|nr:hypothetical protein VaNZ11_015493 [Volvox africanus]
MLLQKRLNSDCLLSRQSRPLGLSRVNGIATITIISYMNKRNLASLFHRGIIAPNKAKQSDSPGFKHPNDVKNSMGPSILTVLLYIPNLICYGRLALLAAATLLASARPGHAVMLLLISFSLDGIDGAVARRLCQTSAFGSFLDVAVDLASRGLVWSWAVPGGFGAAVLLLEAITFTCTHAGGF